jgi:hypothetical protein
MIINLTDSEALAIATKLQERPGPIDVIDIGDGAISGEVDEESLNSAIAKIQAGMVKSDNKLSRTLNIAIESLTSSGFDVDQITALQTAKNKAEEHNAKKYLSKNKEKSVL